MTVFFLNVFILLLFGFVMIAPRYRRLGAILLMGYFAFLTMFRGHSVGTDTPTYCLIFKQIAESSHINFLSYIKLTGTEPGFVLLCRLLSYISNDPQILLIACGLFCYISLTIIFLRYSNNIWMTIYMFFMLGGFDFFASGLRQSVSIAFILIAFQLLENNKKIIALIIVIVSCFFHYSAVIVFPLYLLLRIKEDEKFVRVSTIATIIVFVFFNPFLSMALRYFPKYNYYYQGQMFNSEPNLAVFLKLIVFLLIYLVGKYIVKDSPESRQEMKKNQPFDRLALMQPLVYVISFNARALARFALYLSLFSYIYFPNKIAEMERKNKLIVIVLSLLLFFLYAFIIQYFKTPEWQSTYPYVFCWE